MTKYIPVSLVVMIVIFVLLFAACTPVPGPNGVPTTTKYIGNVPMSVVFIWSLGISTVLVGGIAWIVDIINKKTGGK